MTIIGLIVSGAGVLSGFQCMRDRTNRFTGFCLVAVNALILTVLINLAI